MGPHGTLGPWDRASWDPRDSGTLGHWDPGTLGPWDTGTLGPWDRASWDPRDPGTGPLGTPGTRGAVTRGPGQNENFYPPLAPKVPCQIVQIDIKKIKITIFYKIAKN